MSTPEVFVEPTPNPNALKFIVDRDVIKAGKATFKSMIDCENIPLAQSIFDLRGVDQIHFFQNVITQTRISVYKYIRR